MKNVLINEFIDEYLLQKKIIMASSKLEYLKKYMSKEDDCEKSIKKKKKKKRVKDPGG